MQNRRIDIDREKRFQVTILHEKNGKDTMVAQYIDRAKMLPGYNNY